MRNLPRLSLTRVVILLAVIVVGYFVFSAIGDTLRSRQLDQDHHDLQVEIADLERQALELEAIREYLQTDDYIEGVARHVLGLVRPGETLVIVSTNATPTPSPADGRSGDEHSRWWEQIYNP